MTVPTIVASSRDATTDPGPVPAGVREEREWVFTFGSGQRCYSGGTYPPVQPVPDGLAEPTGFRLDDRFVVVYGTFENAREAMFAIFGRVWSMQYSSRMAAGVDTYGLTELVLTSDFVPRAAI